MIVMAGEQKIGRISQFGKKIFIGVDLIKSLKQINWSMLNRVFLLVKHFCY